MVTRPCATLQGSRDHLSNDLYRFALLLIAVSSSGCAPRQSLTRSAVVSYNASLYVSLGKCFLVVAAARVEHGWTGCVDGFYLLDFY